jgi:hypothetical protein
MAAGQVVLMNLPDAPGTNPWQAYAGIWKDHPDFEDFIENIVQYRRSVDRPAVSQ